MFVMAGIYTRAEILSSSLKAGLINLCLMLFLFAIYYSYSKKLGKSFAISFVSSFFIVSCFIAITFSCWPYIIYPGLFFGGIAVLITATVLRSEFTLKKNLLFFSMGLLIIWMNSRVVKDILYSKHIPGEISIKEVNPKIPEEVLLRLEFTLADKVINLSAECFQTGILETESQHKVIEERHWFSNKEDNVEIEVNLKYIKEHNGEIGSDIYVEYSYKSEKFTETHEGSNWSRLLGEKVLLKDGSSLTIIELSEEKKEENP